MSDRHDWNSWNSYKAAHEGHMSRFFSWEWMIDDGLEIVETPRAVSIKGILRCQDGVEIQVAKVLEVRGDNGWMYVKTIKYSYHVMQVRLC